MSFKEPKPDRPEEPESPEVSQKVDPEFLPLDKKRAETQKLIERAVNEIVAARMLGDHEAADEIRAKCNRMLLEMGEVAPQDALSAAVEEVFAKEAREGNMKMNTPQLSSDRRAPDMTISEKSAPSMEELASEAAEENWKLHGGEKEEEN